MSMAAHAARLGNPCPMQHSYTVKHTKCMHVPEQPVHAGGFRPQDTSNTHIPVNVRRLVLTWLTFQTILPSSSCCWFTL